MKTFFTSDQHFGHYNIINFDRRPFKSTENMDAELIRRWNAKVDKDDRIYILGDLIWKCDDVSGLLARLNGTKTLIKGNHDHRWLGDPNIKKLLSAIKDYDDIKVTLASGVVKRCILSHYPIHFYNGHYHGSVMLYGHVHQTKECKLVREYAKWLAEHGCPVEMYNVGCMCFDYEPVTLDEILEQNKSQI